MLNVYVSVRMLFIEVKYFHKYQQKKSSRYFVFASFQFGVGDAIISIYLLYWKVL